MLTPLYEKVKAHFGIDSPTEFLNQPSQQVKIDPRIRDLLAPTGSRSCRGRRLPRWPARFPTIATWTNSEPPGGKCRAASTSRCTTIRCVTRRLTISITFNGRTLPTRHDSRIFRGGQELHEQGQAVLLYTGVGIFTPACQMRSVEQILFDLAADPEFVTALLTKIGKLTCDCLTAALRKAGEYIDIVVTGDDVASQAGPMMSPAMYRRLIKPHHARMFAAIRANTKAKIYLHSCGNVYRLIGDFIDVGVELLNPVQVSAGEMGDTARLKREFGDRLSFLGGIDTQWALPFGTSEDVRAEVRWRIRDLAPGGGYIAAAVHCLQPDVPLENVLAMCDEVMKAGRYPLAV